MPPHCSLAAQTKKIIPLMMLLSAVTLFLYAVRVMAAENVFQDIQNFQGGVGDSAGYVTTGEAADLTTFVKPLVQAVFGITGTIFFVYMFYGGYLWFTAGGNEDRVKRAHEAIRNAIIGLIIVVGSYSITGFILGRVLGFQ